MNTRTLFRLMLLSAVLLMSAGLARAKDNWEEDYDKAAAAAKASGKYMLLDFSGSDWCGWCIKLDREVFSQKEFQDYAKDSLVLVLVDFPRQKKLPAKTVKQNEGLSQKYGIRGYPTIVILGPDGKLVGQTGYQPGGAAAYVTHLKELIGSPAKSSGKAGKSGSK